MTLRLTYFVGLLALCFSGNAQAANIVYDDLGSGGSVYQHGGGGWDATGPSSGTCNFGCGNVAFSFTPTVTSYLTQLQLGVGFASGTNSVTVELLSDSTGSPGAILESWNVQGLPSDTACCTLQTLLGNGTLPLLAGSNYWLSVLPGGADTFAIWQYNSTGATGPGYADQGSGLFGNGSDDIEPAFEVAGVSQPTPEPRTALTLTAGILLILGLHLRRIRNGLRVSIWKRAPSA
jgi:hypothetical protein